jgi:NAD(P)-dependent dehydrogenase (short-subunit alcohol dehydrogenase family)
VQLNSFDLTGRTILITGASSGIGRATAILISQLGGKVVAVGRSKPALQSLGQELGRDEHVLIASDLMSIDDIPRWFRDLSEEHGLFSGLVHSAGINKLRPLRVLTPQDYIDVDGINVRTAIMLAKGFRQKDVRAQAGSIVFVSSVAALKGQPGLAAYAAGKGALLSVTRTLAVELAKEKVRVNCVCPGFIQGRTGEETRSSLPSDAYEKLEQAHLLGFGTSLDVAYSIAFLLGDAARWITGTSLVCDGGFSA